MKEHVLVLAVQLPGAEVCGAGGEQDEPAVGTHSLDPAIAVARTAQPACGDAGRLVQQSVPYVDLNELVPHAGHQVAGVGAESHIPAVGTGPDVVVGPSRARVAGGSDGELFDHGVRRPGADPHQRRRQQRALHPAQNGERHGQTGQAKRRSRRRLVLGRHCGAVGHPGDKPRSPQNRGQRNQTCPKEGYRPHTHPSPRTAQPSPTYYTIGLLRARRQRSVPWPAPAGGPWGAPRPWARGPRDGGGNAKRPETKHGGRGTGAAWEGCPRSLADSLEDAHALERSHQPTGGWPPVRGAPFAVPGGG